LVYSQWSTLTRLRSGSSRLGHGPRWARLGCLGPDTCHSTRPATWRWWATNGLMTMVPVHGGFGRASLWTIDSNRGGPCPSPSPLSLAHGASSPRGDNGAATPPLLFSRGGTLAGGEFGRSRSMMARQGR